MVGQAMAPKTSPKPKEKGSGLSAPVVSAADIAKAKEALQDDKNEEAGELEHAVLAE